MVNNIYTDEELRLAILPHAMRLLNTEVYRTLKQCNTQVACAIVTELVDFIKTGNIPNENSGNVPQPKETTNDQSQTQAA